MRRLWKNSLYDMYCISRYLYQCYSKAFYGVVSIAQLVEMTSIGVLDGEIEVVSSNSAVGHNYFSAFTTIVDFSYLSISTVFIKLYQFLIRCRSKLL